ncbi:MAG: TonB-dependent receptor [Bacteroidaceae bacterium]|nr:TonB-dependent receptor [Bacteroidaceae bacterium]
MAQKVTVSGVVMDGSLNEPMTGASVVLLQPKDSAQSAGISTDLEGRFKLPAVKAGNYIMRISYMGFQTYYRNIVLPKNNKSINLGTITLQENSKMMKEAEVTARVAQVEMKADTFVFNADAYRMPEGSMLEELVKKLPGAEIDDDGNIKINGKSVSKIMVDGKEYFQNDTKMALKNLPSKLIKKLKSYDKKSDYSRITGIDDGEEETVLDLSVKKGMKDGWVGNFDAAYGTEDRYSGKANVNRFMDNSYLSVIGSRNNVNDFGGRWGGGGSGITTSTMGGVTFAWENGKPEYTAGLLKLGGNVRYSSRDSESETRTNSEMFLPTGASQFSNSKNLGTNWSQNVNANFQVEWFPDSMTNILFRPNFSHSDGNSFSNNRSVTFNKNPFEAGLTDPVEEYKKMTDTEGIRVNGNERLNSGDNYSNNVDASLQVNRRLGVPGRNITLNVDGAYSESDNKSYSRSMVRYYQRTSDELNADYQNTMSPSKNYSVQGRFSYTEPILKGTVLQLSYQAQYRFQDTNRDMSIYDKLEEALKDKELTDVSAADLYYGTYNGMSFESYGIDFTQLVRDTENSQYATYREFNQSVNLMFRHNSKLENGQEFNFNAGVNWQPQRTDMEYEKRGRYIDTTRHIQNWAPRLNFRWKISNTSQLRVRYNGRMSQPSMTNLIEVMDNSNPLRISTGNAGLKSSWNDNFNVDYNNYITEKQMGWYAGFRGDKTRRSISNATIYDTESGVNYSRPMNIDGAWSVRTWMGFNTALDKEKHFNLNWSQSINHANNVGYISSKLNTGAQQFLYPVVDMNGLFNYMSENNLLEKANTKSTDLGENLRINYRNDLLEVGVNGGMNYQHARNDMLASGNRDTWFFNYGGNVVVNMPWNMQFSSDISQQSRRGYDDASMNTNELIWNAQLSQNFLKQKNATVSVQWYDILRNRSSISRSLSATNRSDTWTNAIHSYVMVHFIYRFNLLGDKEARAAGFGGAGMGGHGGRGGYGGGGRGGRF